MNPTARNFVRLAALALSPALLIASAVRSAPAKPKMAPKMAPAKVKAASRVQSVVIRVDGSGYEPSVVSVRAGRPVVMKFVSKGTGCANSIVIPALKQKFRLRMGQSKTVTFTPRKGQSIAFACSMDMFHGQINAK